MRPLTDVRQKIHRSGQIRDTRFHRESGKLMADTALGISRALSCKYLFPVGCGGFLVLDEMEIHPQCLAEPLGGQTEWHWCWRRAFDHDCCGAELAKPSLVLFEKLGARLSHIVGIERFVMAVLFGDQNKLAAFAKKCCELGSSIHSRVGFPEENERKSASINLHGKLLE
jgi:hypothetical protein